MKLTRQRLMEMAGLPITEAGETSFVLYVQGDAANDSNAINNAIKQGTFAEVQGTRDQVAEEVYDQAVELVEKDTPYPGIEKPKIKMLFQKNFQALQQGQGAADDKAAEGYMDDFKESEAVDALVVPIGFDWDGDNHKPLITALVSGKEFR